MKPAGDPPRGGPGPWTVAFILGVALTAVVFFLPVPCAHQTRLEELCCGSCAFGTGKTTLYRRCQPNPVASAEPLRW